MFGFPRDGFAEGLFFQNPNVLTRYLGHLLGIQSNMARKNPKMEVHGENHQTKCWILQHAILLCVIARRYFQNGDTHQPKW